MQAHTIDVDKLSLRRMRALGRGFLDLDIDHGGGQAGHAQQAGSLPGARRTRRSGGNHGTHIESFRKGWGDARKERQDANSSLWRVRARRSVRHSTIARPRAALLRLIISVINQVHM